MAEDEDLNEEREEIEEERYEMLWDCEFCGEKKLLGITHKFCAACGSPQNPDKRYFPPEGEEVAVKDNEYVGADKVCPACNTAMSAKAQHCTQCGSPMDGSKQVATEIDDPERDKMAAAKNTSAEEKKGGIPKWIFAVGGAIVLFILAFIFLTGSVKLEVVNHKWAKEIKIEKYGEVLKSNWCSAKPFSARTIRRYRAKKGTKQVKTGETCRTVRKKRGDGSFSKGKRCTPTYRKENVYADKCDYKVKEWYHSRSYRKQGGLSDAIVWPHPIIQEGIGGNCMGCERIGPKLESYLVYFKSTDKKPKAYNCNFKTETKWKSFKKGETYKGDVGTISGSLDCDSLKKK